MMIVILVTDYEDVDHDGIVMVITDNDDGDDGSENDEFEMNSYIYIGMMYRIWKILFVLILFQQIHVLAMFSWILWITCERARILRFVRSQY